VEPGIARTRLAENPDDRMTPLRRQLGVTAFGMNQIVLRPGQRGRIHRHERQEEVYLVLEGTLTLLVDGEEQTVERGELVRVGPELRRQLANRGPDTLTVLALGGDGEHQGRDGLAYPEWETPEAEAVRPVDLPLPPDLPAR
jgi:uncharacterized cupin superfamily protein